MWSTLTVWLYNNVKYLNSLLAKYCEVPEFSDSTVFPSGLHLQTKFGPDPHTCHDRRLSHHLSQVYTTFPFLPSRKDGLPEKVCLNFILRKSPVCHLSRFVADNSYGRSIGLSLPHRVTVTFHPLIPSAFSPLAGLTVPSARPFNLNKTRS
jgi:hypothetical protein